MFRYKKKKISHLFRVNHCSNKCQWQDVEYVFLADNNIDKKELDEIKVKMSRDKDIKRLIRWGTLSIVFQLLLAVVGIALSVCSFSNLIGHWLPSSQSGLDEKILKSILNIIVLFAWLVELYLVFKDFKQYSTSFGKMSKYFLSGKRPRKPLEIWKLYQGSASDSQTVHACSGLARMMTPNCGVKSAYAGQPYYQPIFLNSIDIQWHAKNIKRGAKARYLEFLWNFSEQSIIARADNQYFFSATQRPERSNSVFGILFTSTYLRSEYERYVSKNGNASSIKVFIALNSDEKYNCIKEWIQYTTIPELFKFVDSREDCDLEICNIELMGNSCTKNKKAIRIPIKRYIAIPNTMMQNDSPFPSALAMFSNNTKKIVICPGGAEHNLGLQSIIKYCRWHHCTTSATLTNCRMGIAENAFEKMDNSNFLVGTEELVYGITKRIQGRIGKNKKEESRRGTIYHLSILPPINSTNPSSLVVDLYGVYGYSAMATKILTTFLMSRLLGMKQKNKTVYPNTHLGINDCLDYIIDKNAGKTSIHNCSVGKEWDEKDYINNLEQLQKWLKTEQVISNI